LTAGPLRIGLVPRKSFQSCTRKDAVSSREQRAAALANQRAAAFIRFQMINDHEAMHFLLTDLDNRSRLGFMTALASIAATLAVRSMGEQGALDYLKLLAETSARLAEPD
jgi:hypothetical protein